jgi:hypothetical protein
VLTLPAVAVKLAVEELPATVTEAGTVSAVVLLSEILTAVPPLGAVAESVTVQVDVDPDVTLAGAQLSAEMGESTLIVPPVPETLSEVAFAETPMTLLIDKLSTLSGPVGDSVAEITATTPLPMVSTFTPVAKHVIAPMPVAQLSVLPAVVSAGPATALREVISAGGYKMVHSKPAGAVAPAFNDRFSEREPPLTADPEAKLNTGF